MTNIEFYILTLTILIAFSGIFLVVRTFAQKGNRLHYIEGKSIPQ